MPEVGRTSNGGTSGLDLTGESLMTQDNGGAVFSMRCGR